ncbi:integrase [Methylovulum psychrotolerans]|uniref:Integrase n=1 Tax=Methylovulum psychrotolerans TaxID=1704499 RepID=A0A2S5CRQ9_9GAMM|nr:integrase [Methylovulum psychrotolerans]POZ53509.1 hypothetical protein AADEFJLK_00535 [Methylovulum psychrotolerans]
MLAKHEQPPPINIKNASCLLANGWGNKLSELDMQTAWQRIRATTVATATANNISFEPFNLHDLKRKGITDTDGTLAGKMDPSRHRSPEMMNI